MDSYTLIKTLHILSSTILFGTGIGIAFFMFRSRITEDLQEKYYAVRTTVLADYIFTFPAVIIQPATGFWLLSQSAYGWQETWLLITYVIYVMAGLCWLPVVWIQIQLKQIISKCIQTNTELPPRYHALFNTWFYLGWPAFIGLLTVFFLMVTKPS